MLTWGSLPHQSYMMMMKWCLMSSDVSWHIRDKLWPMPKHASIILYPASTETRRFVRTDSSVRTATSTHTQLLNYDVSYMQTVYAYTCLKTCQAGCSRAWRKSRQHLVTFPRSLTTARCSRVAAKGTKVIVTALVKGTFQPSSLSLSHTHTRTHTHTHTHTHTYWHTRTPPLSLSHCPHTHTHAHWLGHTVTPSHRLSLTHWHTRTLTWTHPSLDSLSLSHTPSLELIHVWNPEARRLNWWPSGIRTDAQSSRRYGWNYDWRWTPPLLRLAVLLVCPESTFDRVCVSCIYTHARWEYRRQLGSCCCTCVTYFEHWSRGSNWFTPLCVV